MELAFRFRKSHSFFGRFDLAGKTAPPAAVSSAPSSSLSGAEVYANNCAICHGDGGVGNEGPRLINNPNVQLTGRSGVKQTVANGRVRVGMPSWGGVLPDEELDSVVDYIRGLEGAPR